MCDTDFEKDIIDFNWVTNISLNKLNVKPTIICRGILFKNIHNVKYHVYLYKRFLHIKLEDTQFKLPYANILI